MTKYSKIFIAFILVGLAGISPSYAFETDEAWFSFQKLQIALGRWSPITNIDIRMDSDISQNSFSISGSPDEILVRLDEKKIELELLLNEIAKLEQCRNNICGFVVNNPSANSELQTLDSEQLEAAIQKMKNNSDQLQAFINYAEVKLLDHLPKIRLYLELKTVDGPNSFVNTLQEIREMVNAKSDLEINSSELLVEVKFRDNWTGSTNFEFIGTVSQVVESMNRSKAAVAERYEALTGIKVVFSENGNQINWDMSSARVPNGITEDTPKEIYDAYVNIKELTVANAEVTRQIIEAALLKSQDSRSELERKTIDAALRESINALIVFTRQAEMNRLGSQAILNREGEMLNNELSGIYATLESAEEKLLTQDLIEKLQERAKYIEDYVANLERGVLEGDKSSKEAADSYAKEILKLSPEDSAKIIEDGISQAKIEAESQIKEIVASWDIENMEK